MNTSRGLVSGLCVASTTGRSSGTEPAAHVRKMFVPPKGEGAEMLNGGAAEVAQRIQEIVQEKLA